MDKVKKNITGIVRKVINQISSHRFITTVIAMFISFSILNLILILNFVTLLGKNIYIY